MNPILPDQANHRRTLSMPRARRLLLLNLLLVVMLAAVAANISRGILFSLKVDDFVEYWAAGRLNMTGGNPYSADELFALQLQVGWDEATPLMMWNPPPALTLVMPFGLLDYGVARWLWLTVSLVLVIGCAQALWELYGGNRKQRLWGLVLSLFFLPSLMVLHIGQIGVWILLGLVGFIALMHHKRWAAAGAVLILVTLKPHLTYLIWAALGLWWLRTRTWALVGGFLTTFTVAWLVPTFFNPQVTSQYLEAVSNAPPLYWMTATLGAYLRQWFGWERQWLQFAPSVVGLAWLVWYWFSRKALWDWKAEMPLLLLVSATTMSFGWPFDLVVLLPAVVQITIWALADPSQRYRIGTLILYAVFNGLVLWQAQKGGSYSAFVWIAPVLLLIYYFVQTRHQYLSTIKNSEQLVLTQ